MPEVQRGGKKSVPDLQWFPLRAKPAVPLTEATRSARTADDTLPKGGFGNLIALPLQRQARDHDNSVFADDDFRPYPDQWAFLASIQRVSRHQLDGLVQAAEGRGRIIGVRMAATESDDDAPWTAPPSRRVKEVSIADPLPAEIELVMGDQIYISKQDLPPALRNRLIFMQCGPVRFRVDARQQAAARPFTYQVIVRPTGFRSPLAPEDDPRIEFQKLQDALSQCESRNRLICGDVPALFLYSGP